MDLLDLCLKRVEETTKSWETIQQQLRVLQGEVTVMKSTQTDLLTMMQRLDAMLRRVVPKVEQMQNRGGREGAMSPIPEAEPKQEASSGKSREIQESAEQQQPLPSSSSWIPPPPNWPRSRQT